MSAVGRTPPPRRASTAALRRFRVERERGLGEDARRLRQSIGLVPGAFIGALSMGLLMVPFTVLGLTNSIIAVAAMLVGALMGGRAGRHLAQARTDVVELSEHWGSQAAFADHARTIAAIRDEGMTLQALGVAPETIQARAVEQMDAAYKTLQSRIESRTFVEYEAGGTELDSPRSTVAAIPAPPIGAGGIMSAGASGPMSVLPPPEVPSALIEAKRAGTLVPFIGAGLSLGIDVKGRFPSWGELPGRLLEQCPEYRWDSPQDQQMHRSIFFEPDPADPTREVPRIMTLGAMLGHLDALKRKLSDDYGKALAAIFRPADGAPGAAHQAIMAMGAQILLTTNYDRLLEAQEGPPRRDAYTWKQSDRALADIKAGRKVLFKVHGSVEAVDSVVLTANEYAAARADASYRMVVNHLLIANTVFFVGYGMSDPQDLDLVLAEHAKALPSGGTHFALLQTLGPTQRQAEIDRKHRLLRDHHVAVITFDSFSQVVPFLEALEGDVVGRRARGPGDRGR